MTNWAFYPAFVGTFISIVAWAYLAYKEHLSHLPRTLSELAAEKIEALRYYRTVLWTCGPLFAITTLLFIVPRITHPVLVATACATIVTTEMVVGVFPAQRGRITAHDIIAAVMGFAMTAAAYLFAWNLSGNYRVTELTFAILLTILAALTNLDRRRYLFYELPFIFLSHFSILVAALALR